MVTARFYDRLLKAPRRSFFLFGMRGTGKSTWARKTFPHALYFDLLDEGLFQSYLREPRLFGGELSRIPAGRTVVVDEVQRLPWLLNEVHRFIENRSLRFVLLGSSARKLKQAGTNLLAGRAVRRIMSPLLPRELDADFNLAEVLRFGSLPVIWTSPAKAESLDAYVQLYLKQEIQAEALVRNLPGFARFLPVAALFHGQVLNTSGLARDAGVARTTVTGYLEILSDTHLVWLLPAYEARLRVKERTHPKVYWVDAGIMRAVKREFHPPGELERGALLEGWVGALLKAYGEPGSGLGLQHDELFYWAPAEGGTEVDFLIRRGKEFSAVEVKARERLSAHDFKGLKAIAALKGLRRRVVVFLGERPYHTEDGIEALPVLDFLQELERQKI
ncbi:MAG: ATP-binding protein [Candidatus Aminicenantes bacterium]|nr:ATP-binding protein [Candidatus Aminicenantes bacterium]